MYFVLDVHNIRRYKTVCLLQQPVWCFTPNKDGVSMGARIQRFGALKFENQDEASHGVQDILPV